jgi:hypothetical protein
VQPLRDADELAEVVVRQRPVQPPADDARDGDRHVVPAELSAPFVRQPRYLQRTRRNGDDRELRRSRADVYE